MEPKQKIMKALLDSEDVFEIENIDVHYEKLVKGENDILSDKQVKAIIREHLIHTVSEEMDTWGDDPTTYYVARNNMETTWEVHVPFWDDALGNAMEPNAFVSYDLTMYGSNDLKAYLSEEDAEDAAVNSYMEILDDPPMELVIEEGFVEEDDAMEEWIVNDIENQINDEDLIRERNEDEVEEFEEEIQSLEDAEYDLQNANRVNAQAFNEYESIMNSFSRKMSGTVPSLTSKQNEQLYELKGHFEIDWDSGWFRQQDFDEGIELMKKYLSTDDLDLWGDWEKDINGMLGLSEKLKAFFQEQTGGILQSRFDVMGRLRAKRAKLRELLSEEENRGPLEQEIRDNMANNVSHYGSFSQYLIAEMGFDVDSLKRVGVSIDLKGWARTVVEQTDLGEFLNSENSNTYEHDGIYWFDN